MTYLDKFKRELAYYMRRLCRKGLTSSSGGNLSCMVSNKILMTPSGIDKESLKSDDIVVMDLNGKILESPSRALPSIEHKFHLMVYRKRRDVSAVVHAHPLYLSLLSATKLEIDCRLIAESYAILGAINYVPFELMGSQALADSISSSAASSNCIVMRNHGVIALGKDLFQAFDRVEVAENASKLTLLSRQIPESLLTPINEDSLREIDRLMKREEQ